jgi:hypothetical protein
MKECSVAVEKNEAEEVEEGDAEAEAGGGAPGSERPGGKGGGLGGGGDAGRLQTGPREAMILDVGRFRYGASFESREEIQLWSWEDRPRSRFVVAMVRLL